MDPLREAGKLFVILGVVMAAVGAALMLGSKLPFRLGRLPGDIVYQGRNTAFYFPIVTCLVLSAALTAIFWVVSLIKK